MKKYCCVKAVECRRAFTLTRECSCVKFSCWLPEAPTCSRKQKQVLYHQGEKRKTLQITAVNECERMMWGRVFQSWVAQGKETIPHPAGVCFRGPCIFHPEGAVRNRLARGREGSLMTLGHSQRQRWLDCFCRTGHFKAGDELSPVGHFMEIWSQLFNCCKTQYFVGVIIGL